MTHRLNYAEKGARHVPGKKRGHVLYRKRAKPTKRVELSRTEQDIANYREMKRRKANEHDRGAY